MRYARSRETTPASTRVARAPPSAKRRPAPPSSSQVPVHTCPHLSNHTGAPDCHRRWLTLYPVYTIQPVVQTGYNQFENRLYRVNKHSTGWQTGCQTCLTTSLTTVLNEQPLFVQPVVNPVWQPVVSCIETFNRLSNQFDNRFGNRLYRANGALDSPCYISRES